MTPELRRFVVKRLVGLLAALLAASFIVYAALYVAPGSPIAFLSGGRTLPPETIAGLEALYGLDQSFFGGYAQWLGDAVRLDFGDSIVYSQPVSELLLDRLTTSVLLVSYSALLIVVIGIPLGVLAALRGGWTDSLVTGTTAGALAVPPFVAAVLLISIFSVGLGLFPVFGAGEGLGGRLSHLTLPALALAATGVAYVTQVTRSAIRDEMGSRHVEIARGRGLPERLVVRRHILRNALIPITTATGLIAAYLIAGSVIVEQAFQLNGVGSYLVASVDAKDFPAVQATMLLLVAAFVVINTLVDLLYPLIDPRVSLDQGEA